MFLKRSAAIACILVSLSGCVIHVNGNSEHSGSYSKVFGGIEIRDGQNVNELSTVNGGIEIGSNVTAGDVSTVNGGVEIGNNTLVKSIAVVNGDIEAQKSLTLEGDATSVNGDISFEEGSSIGGSITNVNGDIELNGTTLSGSVETVNGDINLVNGSVVLGDVSFKRPNKNSNKHRPTLYIDDSVILKGNIVLEREVELMIPAALESVVVYTDPSM